VESLSLEIFRSHLDMDLGSPACVGRLNRMTSRGSFQPQPFCDSVIDFIFIWFINISNILVQLSEVVRQLD